MSESIRSMIHRLTPQCHWSWSWVSRTDQWFIDLQCHGIVLKWLSLSIVSSVSIQWHSICATSLTTVNTTPRARCHNIITCIDTMMSKLNLSIQCHVLHVSQPLRIDTCSTCVHIWCRLHRFITRWVPRALLLNAYRASRSRLTAIWHCTPERASLCLSAFTTICQISASKILHVWLAITIIDSCAVVCTVPRCIH